MAKKQKRCGLFSATILIHKDALRHIEKLSQEFISKHFHTQLSSYYRDYWPNAKYQRCKLEFLFDNKTFTSQEFYAPHNADMMILDSTINHIKTKFPETDKNNNSSLKISIVKL